MATEIPADIQRPPSDEFARMAHDVMAFAFGGHYGISRFCNESLQKVCCKAFWQRRPL